MRTITLILAALAVAIALPLPAAAACTLQWDYDSEDAPWIDGFRVFHDGAQVGQAGATDRSALCADVGLVPGPGPITMTAYRGTDESPQSDPATFTLAAPGLRIELTAQ